MLSVVDIARGAVVEEHAHPHEQVGMVLQGRAVFVIGGEEKTLKAGDLYRIPGGVRHRVRPWTRRCGRWIYSARRGRIIADERARRAEQESALAAASPGW